MLDLKVPAFYIPFSVYSDAAFCWQELTQYREDAWSSMRGLFTLIQSVPPFIALAANRPLILRKQVFPKSP